MTLQGIGVMQPAGNGPFQLRLRFDRDAYCAIELKKGEASKRIAKKFRELALGWNGWRRERAKRFYRSGPLRPACGPPAALLARQ